ncbi:HlyD family efflux transporter periplasmic adaptor subunit [Chromobacterium haemolyticum]|nr:HlyD family efflux transporter periplasmic adaptor subunit [Chromobacterium haemolyticum]
MAVELGWFIARPVVGELMVWWQRRTDLRWGRATRRSAAALLVLMLALILPWQREVASPAVLGALQSQGLYAPAAGEVAEVLVRDGQLVKAGQVMARLSSPMLEAQLALAGARERDLAWQTAQQPFNLELQQRGPALHKQWQVAQEQVAALRQQMARLTLAAPFAGRVVDVSDALRAGTALAEGEHLLDVVGPEGVKGEAFVEEAALNGLKPGHVARFVADGGEFWSVECRLGQIDRLNLPLLDQPLLASTYGGPVPTEQRDRGLVPLAATFRVRLERCDRRGAPLRELAGVARLQGERYSLLERGARQLLAVFRREAGL